MLRIHGDVQGAIDALRRDGFAVLRDALSAEAREMIAGDIRSVAQAFFGGTPSPFDLQAYQPGHPEHPERRGGFYNLLRYVASLSMLGGCPEMMQVSRMLGLATPVVMKASNIRMDLPHEDQFMFHWHQDITYLLGSLNSLTYWIPLTPVNRLNSTIEVIPGSHRSGIAPFRYLGPEAPQKNRVMSPQDIRLVEEPAGPGVFIEAEPGDVVVFSQLLLHRSTPNRSNMARWTVQVRHTDIDPGFIAAGCPLGDRANIFSCPGYYGASSAGQQP